MKITYEFNTDIDGCDLTELHAIEQATDMAYCISEIQNKVRGWVKYDNRDSIPVEEIEDTIYGIINEHVNMEKLGY